jgi:hypothetical protein
MPLLSLYWGRISARAIIEAMKTLGNLLFGLITFLLVLWFIIFFSGRRFPPIDTGFALLFTLLLMIWIEV